MTNKTYSGLPKPAGRSGHFYEPERHKLQAKGIKTGNNVKLLTPYVERYELEKGKVPKDFFRIVNVPAFVAKKAFAGDPPLKPEDRQNESPTMKRLVEIAEKHNGKLEGYVIPKESGREDARVTFDGLTLYGDDGLLEAAKLKKATHPDEFNVSTEGIRLWWD
jgi:hypothetical protein